MDNRSIKDHKSMNPLISVIICNRNGETYLSQAINSILSQTFSNFELLIIESSTTDKSLLIEKQLASKDSRIRIIQYDKIGRPSALNKGIDEARGKYIAKMDSDDISQSTRLEKEVKLLESNPDIGLVHTSGNLINSNGNILGQIRQNLLSRLWPLTQKFDSQMDNQLWDLLRWDYILSSSVMIRSNIIKANRFDEIAIYPRPEDWDLWIRLAKKYKFAKINEALYSYRIHQESSTNFIHIISLNMGICWMITRWMKRHDFTLKERLRLFTTMLICWIETPYIILEKLSNRFGWS